MREALLGWVTIGIIVPILIGVGFSVMSTSPPEFRYARWCFTVALLILALKFGLWLTVEQPEGLSLIGALSIIVVYLFIGALWLWTMSWIDTRQAAFVSDDERRAKRRAQREALAAFLLKGSQLRAGYLVTHEVSDVVAKQWLQEVADYLGNAFDSSVATRWGSNEGVLTHFELNSSIPEQNRRIRGYLSVRLQKLEQIIDSLDG